MALTQVTSGGLKDDAVIASKISDDAVTEALIADDSIDEARLKISNSGSNGQFLQKQSGNTGGLTWTAVDLTALNASNLTSGTVAAARLDTATTQSASNNSTKIATTAYVETAVSNLVDSAPGALNTLNELAAALGDDANFSTTVTNSIATKLPLAGGTLTGALTATDGVTIDAAGYAALNFESDRSTATDNIGGPIFKAGGNTKSKIQSLVSGQINLIGGSGSEKMIAAIPDGAVELYYDNAKQLETYSSGIQCTNDLKLYDSKVLRLGTASLGDLKLYHDGSNSKIDNVTGELQIFSDTFRVISKSTDENIIKGLVNGAVELYFNGSKKLETTADGIEVTGKIFSSSHIDLADNVQLLIGTGDDLQIYHDGTSSRIHNLTGNLTIKSDNILGLYTYTGTEAMAKFNANGAVELYYDNSKKFETYLNGVKVLGNLWLQSGGAYHSDNVKYHFGNSDDLQIYHDGSNSYIQDSGTGNLILQATDFQVKGYNTGEVSIESAENGAVNLYHNNSKKFETHSAGCKVSAGNLYLDRDNAKLVLGASDDLHIYHDGSNSYIKDAGTGRLKILTNHLDIKNAAENESIIQGIENGAVELYYDNSKKLETLSDGVLITGQCRTTADFSVYDNVKFKAGSSSDLQIYHDGTNSVLINNTNELYQKTATNMHLRVAGDEKAITMNANGTVELYYNNVKHLATGSEGIFVYGAEGADATIRLFADEGDDNADLWKINAAAAGGFFLENYTSGAWETNIKANGNGSVDLYHNNSKKFETTSGGAKVTGDLEVTGDITGGVGKVLQVITTTITGQQSGTNNSDSSENTTDLTGFSLNITPSSTSSKILLMASVSHSSTNWSFCIHAYRDSTIIAQGDALGGNRTQYTWLCAAARDHNDANTATTFHIIDSPSSTSQITYKLKGCSRGTNSTWNINKAARHASYNTGWIQSCVSTFTLMEIG